jgi:hypothetical protein
MATANLSANFQMNNNASLDVADPSTMSNQSSSSFSMSDTNGFSVSIGGSGFSFSSANGDLVSGTMTTLETKKSGQTTFSISGASVATSNNTYDTGYGGEAPGMQGELAYWLRGNDIIIGAAGNEMLKGYGGNDTLTGGTGNDVIDGGSGSDAVGYTAGISSFKISKTGSGYTVTDKTGFFGNDTLTNVEVIKFTDKTVNVTVKALATSIPQADVTRLTELYVAFFNRVPDADGLAYWIGQMGAGQGINQVADSFYNAGVQYTSLTGFSSNMSNGNFIDVIYRNVLGRSEGADAEGKAYWSGKLADGSASRGSLVSSILDSAHAFKGNGNWGWVADLLDNKIAVAKTFAIDLGLNYNTPSDSISQGMAIAAAITSTNTTDAIALIGVSASDIQLN